MAVHGDPSEALAEILKEHAPQGILEGRGSFVLPGAESEPLPPIDGNPPAL